jgi:hypothetical protein
MKLCCSGKFTSLLSQNQRSQKSAGDVMADLEQAAAKALGSACSRQSNDIGANTCKFFVHIICNCLDRLKVLNIIVQLLIKKVRVTCINPSQGECCAIWN